MADKLVYTVKELAEVLQTSLDRAYKLTKSKGFPVMQMGKKRLIPIADLDRWISEQARQKKSIVFNGKEGKNEES